MKNDLMLVESELSIAVNKMQIMAESLSASVEEYVNIMDKVRSDGICDVKIDGEILDISNLAKNYEAAIYNVSASLAGIVKDVETQVEDNQDFDYPMSIMDGIIELFKALI